MKKKEWRGSHIAKQVTLSLQVFQITIDDIPLGQAACWVRIKEVMEHFQTKVGNPDLGSVTVGLLNGSKGTKFGLGTHGTINLWQFKVIN
jgi:hypothetical protein